jgi:hypothetical protein
MNRLVEHDYKKEIERIIDELECPKDFECYKSKFDVLSMARDIGMDSIIECLEKDRIACSFAISFGYACFCKCPLRVFISKKLNK